MECKSRTMLAGLCCKMCICRRFARNDVVDCVENCVVDCISRTVLGTVLRIVCCGDIVGNCVG